MSLLVDIAKKRFSEPKSQVVHFVSEPKGNELLNNLQEYPHAFVLACLMDRQIKAERAWIIPYFIYNEIGSFKIKKLISVSARKYRKIFNREKLHRFNDTMADIFCEALHTINSKYSNDASQIWANKPGSASVVMRFMEFKGSGIKISTMAANILARQFRVPFSDYYSIDISPDVHIIRVMKRMGFFQNKVNNDMIIYKARELNPEFPGIIDYSCWEIGRTWCRPRNPKCIKCIVNKECKKAFRPA